jgi:ABC-type polysaccharide/polyol phosphate export permease
MSWLSDDGPIVFLVLTVILGGGAAFLSGRGLARSWKPFPRLFFYMAPLAAAVRFFHYALFDGELLSLYYYLVTYVLLAASGALGYRAMRTTQMVTQYRWLYERTGPLTWRDRRA